jgi:hypothetical protein
MPDVLAKSFEIAGMSEGDMLLLLSHAARRLRCALILNAERYSRRSPRPSLESKAREVRLLV